MAGTFRGRIECYMGPGENGTNEGAIAQVAFKNVYDVLTSHPNATLVALQHGSGTEAGFSTGGPGTDYYDGAAPFEENAFFVFRMNSTTSRDFDYYILCQWAAFNNFGAAPGNPGSGANTDAMLGFQFAVGIDGDQNPWNGTTNADGTDTKGTPVWTVPAGGTRVHVFPLENRDGDTAGTNKESVWAPLSFNTNSPGARNHFVIDDDNVFFSHDTSDDGTNTTLYFGLYEPRQGFDPSHPLILLQSSGTDGYDTSNNGGVLEVEADGVKNYTLTRLDEIFNQLRHPNFAPSPVEYDEVPVHIILSEGKDDHYIGRVTASREIAGPSIGETNSDGTITYFGPNAGSSNIHVTMPWDGSTTGFSGTTKEGTDFTRAP